MDSEQPPLRRDDTSERFVAFAFAAADLLVEVDADGRITYAAGAFRSRFGRPAEAFVGQPIAVLLSPADRAVLDRALPLIAQTGRLLPITLRLSDPKRTRRALSAIVLAPAGRPRRMCLTFAPLPTSSNCRLQAASPAALGRSLGAQAASGEMAGLDLLEVVAARTGEQVLNEAMGVILETLSPESTASEVAPGRFTVIGPHDPGLSAPKMAATLQDALRRQGIEATVAAQRLKLSGDTLTQAQTANALRRALAVFAREGLAGLGSAGFADGIEAYLRQVGAQAGLVRRVIGRRAFRLVVQPIVKLSGRPLHHYEALIRPQPAPEYRSPFDFVCLAETIGLAEELDLAVAAASCEAAGRLDAPLAFNVSGHSMQSPAFRDTLLTLLAASPAVRDGRMLVEMTETARLDNVAEVRRSAEAIKALGVRFCIDDFGAGSSDVQLLRSLPADVVKLDGSYVTALSEPGNAHAFASGMVEIARAAGAQVLAEFVETEAQALALEGMGVTLGQGWLFGQPRDLPASSTPTAATSPRLARRKGAMAESWG